MHFLCLHGLGTNSHVFETQTASLRHEMDRHHTFSFVEGTIACAIAPEIKAFFPLNDEYFQYYEPTADSVSLAVLQLSRYIAEEGPFDGVIAFSMGAALASTYLIQEAQAGRPLPFRCAVFFSGARPFDPQALTQGQGAFVDLGGKVTSLDLPTAHIWGRKDTRYRENSELLSSLCDEGQKEVFIHNQGHEIPGARAQEELQRCVKVIRRTIERASLEF